MIELWKLIKKIKINPLFWFVLSIGVVSGYFREVLMVFVIVFIHEMGHACAAHYFKWKIHKIELLPFGGVAEVEDNGNHPFREELIIILAGPIQHVWLIGLSFLFVDTSFWSVADHQVFIWHNITLLLFNLIPVFPLDGGRLVQLWCTYRLSYQKALKISWYFSVISLIILFICGASMFPFHLNLWVVLGFLFIANYLERKQRHYRFIRFLMARQFISSNYHYRLKTLRVQETLLVRDAVRLFRRGFAHRLMIKHADRPHSYLDESTLLHALFQEKKLQSSLADILKK